MINNYLYESHYEFSNYYKNDTLIKGIRSENIIIIHSQFDN